MESEKGPSKSSQHLVDTDEIDFFELCAFFWRRKFILLTFTVLGLVLVLAYVKIRVMVYQASLTIAEPALRGAGDLVQPGKNQSVIGSSIALADSLSDALKRNLMSMGEQNNFMLGRQLNDGQTSLSVVEDRDFCRKITQSNNQGRCNSLIITATGTSRELLKSLVEGYLDYSANLTAEEINKIISPGGEPQIKSQELYRVERPVLEGGMPVGQKNIVLIILGAVLGFLLGLAITAVGLLIKARDKKRD